MLEIRFPVPQKKSRPNGLWRGGRGAKTKGRRVANTLARDFFLSTGKRISSIFNFKNEFSVENYPMNVLGLRGKASFIEKL
jgi:hypothetical protein